MGFFASPAAEAGFCFFEAGFEVVVSVFDTGVGLSAGFTAGVFGVAAGLDLSAGLGFAVVLAFAVDVDFLESGGAGAFFLAGAVFSVGVEFFSAVRRGLRVGLISDSHNTRPSEIAVKLSTASFAFTGARS